MHYKVDVGCGSRIIITSRDRHLLKKLDAKIYAVETLNCHEALQLFCLNAFNRKIPEEGFLQLCERAVGYAQGLPLALEVLGSNLFQRSAQEWEDELEKLKVASDQKIHRILRISYEGLCDVEKEIFLDIACCFKGRRRDEVESLLDVRGSRIGISRLSEKALISLDENRIKMHDLIEQMAKDIICEERILGKCRWLWNPEEIYFLLSREMGTEAVRGMTLDMSQIKSISLSATAFLKLFNLRYLHFYVSRHDNARLCIPQGLEYLPEQLRYLYWDQYPLKSLPVISFCAEKLVELTMPYSQLEKLWNGVQDLPNLQDIDLHGSTKLIEVPDLSKASNLTSINLHGCESLMEIPSLKYLSKLVTLILRECSRLESLPEDIGNLKSLWLARNSGIKELPDSICNLKACTALSVIDCKNLHRLPQNLGNLQALKYLHGDGSGIKELPSSINNLRELREFTFVGCKGLMLPPLTGDFPYLSAINLSNCGLSEFPVGHCSMKSLSTLGLCGNNFEIIPESIEHLLKLCNLNLSDCDKLKHLPQSIKLLPELESIFLRDCTSLGQNSTSIDHLTAAFFEGGGRKNLKLFVYPGSEVQQRMKYKNEHGSCLSFAFKLLQRVEHYLEFYACVVFDKPKWDVLFKGNLMDESGLCFNAEGHQLLPIPKSLDQLNHVALCQIHFESKSFVKGSKYTAKIQFQSYPDPPCCWFYINHLLYSSDGISKCGVLPMFDYGTME